MVESKSFCGANSSRLADGHTIQEYTPRLIGEQNGTKSQFGKQADATEGTKERGFP